MPDYQKLYLHNNYEIGLDDGSFFSFSLVNFQNNTLFDQSFAIVTAHNPMNLPLSDIENAILNKKLYNELYNNYRLLPAEGCYKGHCEAGFLIFDISLKEALNVGRKYRQYAIFYNSDETLQYVECKNEKVIVERKRQAP